MKTLKEWANFLYTTLEFIIDELLIFFGLRKRSALIIEDRVYPPREYSDEKLAELHRIAEQYEQEWIDQMRGYIFANGDNTRLGILSLIKFDTDEALDVLAEALKGCPKNVRQHIISELERQNYIKGLPLLDITAQSDEDAELRAYAKQVADKLRSV